MKTIAIAGTFDTKGEEYLYIKQLAEELGLKALMIHTGVFETAFLPEVSNREVASAAGVELDELVAKKDRALATEVLSKDWSSSFPGYTRRASLTALFPSGAPAEHHWLLLL